MEDLLNPKQAAKLLGLTPETLKLWRAKDAGPPFVRLSPRAVRYRPEDLRKFVADREVGAGKGGDDVDQ